LELQRKKSGKAEQVSLSVQRVPYILTERFSEKYLKKLSGNGTDIEDALKRLDNLTQEETRMAAAQALGATLTVDDTGGVRGFADIALGIANRVADVGDRVQGVDDKVTAAMDGA
jgi:hypothetical protein